MKGKILYINQYFKKPSEPGITRSYWIARELVKRGYSVTMLSHKNILHAHVKESKLIERENVDGIDVIYIKNAYSNSMGLYQRSMAFLKFMFFSSYFALKEKNVGYTIATSTPLTVAFPALMRKWFKKTPFIFEVRDLWPEVPIKMGAIKNKLMIRFLTWVEKTTYKNASVVVALSPGMQEGITEYIPVQKTIMVPNMAKIDQFWPRPKNTVLEKQLGLAANSFKIIHFGAMGIVNGLDNFVNAAIEAKARNIQDIEFVLVGHGKMKEKFEKMKQEKSLDNLHIYDRLPMAGISEIVNICDVSYVGISRYKILEINSANKFFDSLSAGKPLILNFAGWMKDIVEQEECGLVADPVNAEDLLEKIITLKTDTEMYNRFSFNSRRLAETKYDKSILCGQFADKVDEVFNAN